MSEVKKIQPKVLETIFLKFESSLFFNSGTESRLSSFVARVINILYFDALKSYFYRTRSLIRKCDK